MSNNSGSQESARHPPPPESQREPRTESQPPVTSHIPPGPLVSTREDHVIAGLAALAIIIHVAESAIPSPLPGVKPGLANVVTMIALCLYGWNTALWVSLLRVLVGSLVIGTFLGPPFYLSLGGATASIVVLAVAIQWNKYCSFLLISPIGLCMLAAMAHMTGQFWIAYFLFVPHKGLFHLLPLLLAAALVSGLITGIITRQILHNLNQTKVSMK